MSDEAVESKTGKNWSRWFKHLDAAGAKKMSHQEIVAHLHEKHGVRPWWTQMVAVTYEQARGLRAKHEKPQGFEISVSRTVSAPVAKAYKAWTDPKLRKAWLPANFKVSKATKDKSLRLIWEDGKTRVAAAFYAKGDKSQVVAQHSKLPDAKAAADMKRLWADWLEQLRKLIE
jgi:uncharacterized protein YndB with AHSA1/START domain